MTTAPTLLVVNCNTDEQMTARIGASARAASAGRFTVAALTPARGPASAEGYLESYITAAASLEAVAGYPGRFDAVVMAGFGEHGREGMRQLVTQPVVDITEAAAFFACLLGHRFGVVTTVASAIAGIEDSLRTCGILGRCSGILASDVPVSHISDDVERTADALEATARQLIARGADAIVLGCAGFAGLDTALERRLGAPVLDPVACAVELAHSLVVRGKRTSKVGPYAPASATKRWVGQRIGT